MLGILTTIVVLIGVWFGVKILTSFLTMALVGNIIALVLSTAFLFGLLWAVLKWDDGEK